MRHQRDHDRKLLRFAREMRAEPTDAERRLWSILRKHRLAGFRFRRQYPVCGYIADFVCLDMKVIIEADGGQHREPEALRYDQERTARLGEVGFEVLRFSDRDILKETDIVANEIYKWLVERSSAMERAKSVRKNPHPDPPPEYQGRG
jgi:very-short-patch-repair endonuclease